MCVVLRLFVFSLVLPLLEVGYMFVNLVNIHSPSPLFFFFLFSSDFMAKIRAGTPQAELNEDGEFNINDDDGSFYSYKFPNGVLVMGQRRKYLMGSVTYSVRKLKVEAAPRSAPAPKSSLAAAAPGAVAPSLPAKSNMPQPDVPTIVPLPILPTMVTAGIANV
jgi:hypothetical protein